jgi:5-methylcytosine-specific restriction enzyme A
MNLGARKQDQRPSARERGYGTAWAKARAGHLRLHPHCATCAADGLIVRATVVDHVIPHRGDQRLFWDSRNWQSLCTNHHASDKQQQEHRGFSSRIGADGLPKDASHPFYAGDEQAHSPRDVGSRSRVGGSKVNDRKGMEPLGFKTAELVSPRGHR